MYNMSGSTEIIVTCDTNDTLVNSIPVIYIFSVFYSFLLSGFVKEYTMY